MKKKFLTVFFLLPFIFLAEEKPSERSAAGQPIFSEQIEVVGRVEQRKVVQSVSTLSQKELRKYELNLIKEVFTLVPGVIHLSTGHPGQLGYLYVRGASPNQTVVAINGLPLSDPASTLGLDLSALSGFLFSRMEFVRGPLSNYLGSNAMGGVFNLVTSRENEFLFQFGLGSEQSMNGGVNIVRRWSDLFLAAGIDGRSYSEGVKNDRYKGVLSRVELGIERESWRAGLQFMGNFSSSGIPRYMGRPTLNRFFKRNFLVFSLPLEINLNSASKLSFNLSLQKHNYQMEDKDNLWSPFYQTGSNQWRTRLDYQYGQRNFSALFSFDFSRQRAQSGNQKDNFSFEKTGNFYASAVNLNWSFDKFVLSGGLRLDKYQKLAAVISPQFGFRWDLNSNLAVRIGASSSFRAPQLPELYNPLWGNPELKPEKNLSFEGGLNLFLNRLELTTCYFYSRYNNLIGYSPLKWKFDNINRATVAGVEFSAGYQFLKGLKLMTILNYLHTHDWQYKRELLRRPKWTAHLRLNYSWKKLTTDLNYSYVGKRLDYNEIIWSVDRSPAYNYTNLAIGYKLTDNLELNLKLSNLFDLEYEEVMGYPAPGRRWSLNLRYRR